jgi:hypothetical protein
MKISIIRELDSLVGKFSSNVKTSYFLGAGTSMSMGMDGIDNLTTKAIDESIYNPQIQIIQDAERSKKPDGGVVTIEDILNSLRSIRSLTGDKPELNFLGISGEIAKKMDIEICNKIYDILMSKEKEITADVKNFETILKFGAWINSSLKEYPIEIYTTNYDLLIEKGLEQLEVPFFDGFIGSFKPFFHQESVENTSAKMSLPTSWVRVWKMHGSLNWFWNSQNGINSVIRTSASMERIPGTELVIYPSKDKYQLSKKQPFTTYFDRLKTSLTKGESISIIHGYSFGDDHINDVFYSALRANQRLHVIAFVYSDEVFTKNKTQFSFFNNLTVISPKQLCKSGVIYDWDFSEKLEESIHKEFIKDNKLIIVDFKKFIDFLITNSGIKNSLLFKESESNE